MSTPCPHSGSQDESIDAIVDRERYPFDDLGSARGRKLMSGWRRTFERDGSLSLPDFLRPAALAESVREVEGPMATQSFHHQQVHNVYFTKTDPDLPAGHGALKRLTTSNLTLTCDQLAGTVIRQAYEWAPITDFLVALLDKPRLYRMDDPLARLNVMAYRSGEGLNWHFDRAHFTVSLLLQAPDAGGEFQYRPNLRAEGDPNYDGVARLLAGQEPGVHSLPLSPGTLNVFAGRYAAHRVTPVEGERMRLIAIMCFSEAPGMVFDADDRIQFYGRAEEVRI